jgi:coenzyme PQQ precursor peptide PqqA
MLHRISGPDLTHRKNSIAPYAVHPYIGCGEGGALSLFSAQGGNIMKVWNKPQVREQEVGLEVTSYLPAEIDII